MVDRALLDTNVLVYALYDHAEHHHASRAILAKAATADKQLVT
jgi:predicted nucleic acid-binding protein